MIPVLVEWAYSIEEPLHCIEPAAGAWTVLFPIGLKQLVKSTQQVFLFGTKIDRRFNRHLREQITHACVPYR